LKAKREEKILRGCYYFMGRTEWDENLTKLYAPESKYFYCSEALRETFVNNDKIWHSHNRNQIILVSTISSPLYKGLDLILKTANLIKGHININFEWRIFGTNEIQFQEWKSKIKAIDVNVKLMGTFSAENLKAELLNADLFIHPSYIDNSPNSVCEAQIIGLPVISTNVGGISSLIEHKITGLLVPANDPYTTTAYIKLLIQNTKFATFLGTNAREVALIRHNAGKLMTDLLYIYEKAITDEKNN
jgi:glycosyltransferase involved in cell wall biosynthesis